MKIQKKKRNKNKNDRETLYSSKFVSCNHINSFVF